MVSEINPMHRKGERNLHCPKYEECLELASREDWVGWCCSCCAFRHRKSPWEETELYTRQWVDTYSVPREIVRRVH
jgi:hypothetical protein